MNAQKTNSLRLTEDEFNEISNSEYKNKGIDLLLNGDKIRIGDEYVYPEEKFRNDPNNGHWDLWSDREDAEKFDKEFTLGGDYYAYDPSEDIQDEAIVAIDFGTSATVVVASTERAEKKPLAIDASASSKRYENPTIMYLVDLDTFFKMYKQRDGRPFTKWEDISVANHARESFLNTDSNNYYAFIHQLKQWAGGNNKTINFKPVNGEAISLPPYKEIKDGEFDPIEIYAYYIGLNVNRLKTNKIYLKYYLSFPVTFSEVIRDKITESFKRGLKKSLPISVLKNKEKMKEFSVNNDVSEPLAYASCVLREYHIKPPKDEYENYAVFDFGGGTADFNYGRWRQYSEPQVYSYEIENLGSSGDKTLGGENLLEGLAFKVFKENLKIMKEGKFFFQLGPDSKTFKGDEDVIDNKSQYAAANMKRLMEKLRPYWQRSYYYNARIIKCLIASPDKELANGELISLIKSEINFYHEKQSKNPNSGAIINKLNELKNKCSVSSDNGQSNQDNKLEFIDIIKDEPFFAQNDDSDTKPIEIKVDLTNENGTLASNKSVFVTLDFIFSYFEDKIRKGISSFFVGLNNIFKNEKEVSIFLAGNSSKSPITTSLFKEIIEEQEKANPELKYKLYYPLGSNEADLFMKEKGIESDYEYGEGPNGKTGVAFGLIDCSEEQGRVHIKNEGSYESKFKYYLGWENDGFFEPYGFSSDLSLSKWHKLGKASRKVITIYGMSNPECLNGKIRVSGNIDKKIPLKLPKVDPKCDVWIRFIDAEILEFTLIDGNEEPTANSSVETVNLAEIGD